MFASLAERGPVMANAWTYSSGCCGRFELACSDGTKLTSPEEVLDYLNAMEEAWASLGKYFDINRSVFDKVADSYREEQ